MMRAKVRGDTPYLYILYFLYLRDAQSKESKESKGCFATFPGLQACSCRKGDAAGRGVLGGDGATESGRLQLIPAHMIALGRRL